MLFRAGWTLAIFKVEKYLVGGVLKSGQISKANKRGLEMRGQRGPMAKGENEPAKELLSNGDLMALTVAHIRHP